MHFRLISLAGTATVLFESDSFLTQKMNLFMVLLRVSASSGSVEHARCQESFAPLAQRLVQ